MKQQHPGRQRDEDGNPQPPDSKLQPWESGRQGGGSNYGHASRGPGQDGQDGVDGEKTSQPGQTALHERRGQRGPSVQTGIESDAVDHDGGQPSTSSSSGLGASEGSTRYSVSGDGGSKPASDQEHAEPAGSKRP